MATIAATGNYGFFNIHTCVLAVALLDDRLLGVLAPLLKPSVKTAQPLAAVAFDGLLVLSFLCGWAIYTAATVAVVSEACKTVPPMWFF